MQNNVECVKIDEVLDQISKIKERNQFEKHLINLMKFQDINIDHLPRSLKELKVENEVMIKELKLIVDRICTHRRNLTFL